MENYLNPDWVQLASEVALDQDPNRIAAVKDIVETIRENFYRYEQASEITRVPAFLIAGLHYRESSFNFTTMLHNGTPLNKVSKIVPVGVGPFGTWVEATVHALKSQGSDRIKTWDMAMCLEFAEAYNGKGYRKRGMYSPYVFSFTNKSDELGGYPSDGKWDPTYVNKRPGVAAIILGLSGQYGT